MLYVKCSLLQKWKSFQEGQGEVSDVDGKAGVEQKLQDSKKSTIRHIHHAVTLGNLSTAEWDLYSIYILRLCLLKMAEKVKQSRRCHTMDA